MRRPRFPVNPAPVAPLPDRDRVTDARAGIVFMALGVSILPIMDGLAKYLGADYGPIQIGMMRFLAQSLFTLPLALWFVGVRALIPAPFGLQALRGVLIGTATTFFFAALQVMPLADTLAIFFVSPLIVTAISALLLGESVGPRRWSAVVAGFARRDDRHPARYRPVRRRRRPAAVRGHLFRLLPDRDAATVRARRRLDDKPPDRRLRGAVPAAGHARGRGGGSAGLGYTAIAAAHLPHLVAIGAIATAGHMLVIKALASAPASTLAPIGYIEMPSAALVGWIAFSDLPDLVAVAGIAIIIGAGLYVSWREHQLARRGA